MPRVPVLPNIITAFGLTCGLFVIFKMNMTQVGQATFPLLTGAAGFLLLAAFADLLDGAVARVMKAESEFGGLFDSLADAISFGVAPAIIVLKSLSIEPGTDLSFFLTAAAMVYTVCGVLRLVRFNVAAQTAKLDPALADASKKNFTGLPIPGAAAAVVSANLFLASDQFNRIINLSEEARAWMLFFVLAGVGYLMVSRWKFPSFKTLHIRVSSFKIVIATVITAVLIFYGMLNHFPLVFLVLSWSYIIAAGVFAIIRLMAGRKSKTLEDFEPEPEDDLDQ